MIKLLNSFATLYVAITIVAPTEVSKCEDTSPFCGEIAHLCEELSIYARARCCRTCKQRKLLASGEIADDVNELRDTDLVAVFLLL